ncbi:polysaccharide deacetylase family protein [Clostridium aminobutyricum]|uniref:Polysaccharide deacetylase family protein n=1 Tax=Clostridium aminobutyricum TaxID=33953 RepID=A0A939D6F3_CLOAM|nr:polysaccharide deacetylase family protein [Clostridium aminobutyricum]MBN7772389.1 polysaccharide deacetylase family protein [Clostridium aminobutyricum]
MKKKIVVLGVVVIALAIGAFQGFTHLDRILAGQVALTWEKINEERDQESTAAEYVSEEGEELIIRNGAEGNNLCTFVCNVDWGEENIPAMLKIFEENNIHVTFFVSGRWAENHPDLLREMYTKGHEIQSHGYSHALCSQVSKEKVKEEIQKTEEAIIDTISIKTNLFAPPAGDYDEKTVAICEELGYKMVLWSSDTIDWREGSTADVIVNRIMSKPLDGAIILMHPKAETVKALPELIKQITAQHYSIVPLYRMPV